MLVKGIIESIAESGYTAKVRIPQIHRVATDPLGIPTEELDDATILSIPGVMPVYKINDVVFVLFENEKVAAPVIVGLLERPGVSTSSARLSGETSINLATNEWVSEELKKRDVQISEKLITSNLNSYSTNISDRDGHWTVQIPNIERYYEGLTVKVTITTDPYSMEGYNTININNIGPAVIFSPRTEPLDDKDSIRGSEYFLTYHSSGVGPYTVTTDMGAFPIGTIISSGWVVTGGAGGIGTDEFNALVTRVDGLEQDIDARLQNYVGEETPTLYNYPCNTWEGKDFVKHIGNVYTNITNGDSFRFIAQLTAMNLFEYPYDLSEGYTEINRGVSFGLQNGVITYSGTPSSTGTIIPKFEFYRDGSRLHLNAGTYTMIVSTPYTASHIGLALYFYEEESGSYYYTGGGSGLLENGHTAITTMEYDGVSWDEAITSGFQKTITFTINDEAWIKGSFVTTNSTAVSGYAHVYLYASELGFEWIQMSDSEIAGILERLGIAEGHIEQHGIDIEELDDRFTRKVWQTDIDVSVNNIKIGHTNLLADTNTPSNAHVDSDMDKEYVDIGSGSASILYTDIESTAPTTGLKYGVQVNITETSANPAGKGLLFKNSKLHLVDGQTYTLSTYIRLLSGVCNLKMLYTNLTGQTFIFDLGTYSGAAYSNWTQISKTFTYSKGSNPTRSYVEMLPIYANNNSEPNACYIQFCGMKLELGNKATDWEESSVRAISLQTQHSTLSQTVSGISTEVVNLQTQMVTKADNSRVDTVVSDVSRVDQKADGIAARVTTVEEEVVQLGITNLLTWPYIDSSKVESGITWTINENNSVKANGTATATSRFTLQGQTSETSLIKADTYNFHGCPVDGSSTTYYAEIKIYNTDETLRETHLDTGSGVTFTLTTPGYAAVSLVIVNPTTVSNIVFYPMLEKGSTVHPYVNPETTTLNRLSRAEATLDIHSTAIESKVSYTDYTGNEIASRINQSATTIAIEAEKINLTGKVTIANLAPATKSSLTKSTTSAYQFYLSTSSTEATGGSWSDAAPTWESGKYVWTRLKTTVTYVDDTTSTVYGTAVYDKTLTDSLVSGKSAGDAASAAQATADGSARDVSSKTQYYLSTSSSSATGGSWSDDPPAWQTGRYIWTRVATTTTPNSGSATTTYSTAKYDVTLTEACAKTGGSINLICDTNTNSMTKVDAKENKYLSDTSTSITTYMTGEFITLTDPPVPGLKYGYKIICTTDTLGAAGRNYTFRNSDLHLVPGETYTMSTYARIVSGSNARLRLRCDKRDPNAYAFNTYIDITNTDWKQYSYTFTYAESSTSTETYNRISPSGICGNHICAVEFCGMKLEKGTTATDWCESAVRYATIESLASTALQNTVKNLIPYPYYHKSPRTINGITFTVDTNDGSVTANGTATADANFILKLNDTHTLAEGSYMLSGCPSGGTSTTYFLYLNRYTSSSSSSADQQFFDYGDGRAVTITSTTGYWASAIYIKSGTTVSNLKFYPMLETGSTKHSFVSPISQLGSSFTSIVPVYYRSTSSSTPSDPGNTVVTSTVDDTDNTWTLSILKPKNGTYFFQCSMCMRLNSDVPIYTTVTKMSDLTASSLWCNATNSTYIEGSKIYTGTVNTDQLAANAITAAKISAGAVTADKISVTDLKAIGATIGGWNISTNYIYSTRTVSDITYGLYLRRYYTDSINTAAIYLSKVENGTTTYPFRLNYDGSMVATNATISGTITTGALTATGGKIGGWSISATSIYKDATISSKTYRPILYCPTSISANTTAFAVYNVTDNTYPFKVSYSGALTATNATITGEITATTGEIGGWTINSTSIFKSTTTESITYKAILEAPTTISHPSSQYAFRVQVDGTYKFGVRYDGSFLATVGIIGGFTLTSTTLVAGSTTSGTGMGMGTSTDSFWAGRNSYGARFRVNSSGSVFTNTVYLCTSSSTETTTYNYLSLSGLYLNQGATAKTSYGSGACTLIGTTGRTNGKLSSNFSDGSYVTYYLYGGNSTDGWGYMYAAHFTTMSDRRLKTNIRNLTNAESLIYNLRPVTYNYTTGLDTATTHCGLIAQEVQEVIYNNFGNSNLGIVAQAHDTENLAADEEPSYGIDYSEIVANLIAVVQSQNERINRLEEIITNGN